MKLKSYAEVFERYKEIFRNNHSLWGRVSELNAYLSVWQIPVEVMVCMKERAESNLQIDITGLTTKLDIFKSIAFQSFLVLIGAVIVVINPEKITTIGGLALLYVALSTLISLVISYLISRDINKTTSVYKAFICDLECIISERSPQNNNTL